MERRNFSRREFVEQHNRGRFENPYFRHRHIHKKRKRFFFFLFVMLVFFGSPLVYIFGPWNTITSLSVEGMTTIPRENIENVLNAFLDQKRFGIIPQRNRHFLSKTKLTDELQSTFQLAHLDVEIKKSTLHIILEEQISEVVWVSGEDMYMLDLDGFVLRSLTESERATIANRLFHTAISEDVGQAALQPTMPIIFNDQQQPVVAGERAAPFIDMPAVIAFDKALRKLVVTPKTYGIENNQATWLRVDTETAFDVLFDASGTTDEQVAILESILQDYHDLQVEQYIDLRFGNRVYTK